jgi:3-phenylpropionate/trans-cinnamate dioxygenase ferredoxin reductase component
MDQVKTYVVVGGGQAAAWVLKTLRAEGFTGNLIMIAAEAHSPYERPPLSKAILAGSASFQSAYLFDDNEFQALNIQCLQPDEAIRIDRDTQHVYCRSGRVVRYDQLVLATGGGARLLCETKCNDVPIYYLRTLDDALALKVAMQNLPRQNMVVIGGGWVGLEVAATARKMGIDVTVVVAADRLCVRSVPEQVSAILLTLHQKNGVDIRLNAQLECLTKGQDGILVTLIDGGTILTDLVVVGIGQVPNTSLALEAGLEVSDGIVVDEQGRTSDPSIFCCGDVANQFEGASGQRLRLESWANAQNQAVVVAKALLGQPVIYKEVPWFWSDQYDVNLQILGFAPIGCDIVIRGDVNQSDVTFFYFKGPHLCSVIAINNGRNIKVAKRWMNSGKVINSKSLTDVSIPLTP